ncbi:bsr1553 [Bradyrhizobium diazoefficiens USDA 110]|uniref:Bsr1553 protein n=1 Tax=Bradyrhizobium diazoefficiens (strain JCM 10833 / BCRC 13528 / IAM 13628 / NBRC 14792 / USDA 110) TaxID=224911 RepID=Q89U66_BRADU|nr:bsr1553 [Bradyrhizobium diazoefficiens USDA 110]
MRDSLAAQILAGVSPLTQQTTFGCERRHILKICAKLNKSSEAGAFPKGVVFYVQVSDAGCLCGIPEKLPFCKVHRGTFFLVLGNTRCQCPCQMVLCL